MKTKRKIIQAEASHGYVLKDARRNKAACFQLLDAKSQSVVAELYSDDLAPTVLHLLNNCAMAKREVAP